MRAAGDGLREGTAPVAHHRALASAGGGGTLQDLDFNRIILVASLRIDSWFSRSQAGAVLPAGDLSWLCQLRRELL